MRKMTAICCLLLLWQAALAQKSLMSPHITDLFTPVPPSVSETGLMGYENPAMSAFNHGFSGFLGLGSSGPSAQELGLFLGVPHLGLGVVNHRFGPLSQTDAANTQHEYLKQNDFRISTAWGGPALSWGVGYGWSSSNSKSASFGRHVSAGVVTRPHRTLSLSLSARQSLDWEENRISAVAGWRPLAKRHLILFGRLSHEHRNMNDFSDISDSWTFTWGAQAEPAPGMAFFGHFSRHEARAGLTLQLGRIGFLFQGRKVDNQSEARASGGVYFGRQRDNIRDRKLRRNTAYLMLNIDGPVVYRKPLWGSGRSLELYEILESLRLVQEDPRVAGVVIRLSGAGPSAVLAWELRQALLKLKNLGKSILIFADRPGMSGMHLASAANRLAIDPEGMIIMPGYGLSRTYIKNLLDKLGIGFEEWRFFSHKSAFEGYARSGMSEADRSQRQAWLDDIHTLFVKDVAAGRNLPQAVVDSLIQAQGVFLAREAVQRGLADTLASWSSARALASEHAGRPVKLIAPGQLLGRALPASGWGDSPEVAVVYAQGECATDAGINARQLSRTIERIAADNRVRALVLRVDSPGGDGMASDWVARAVRACKKQKPVVVSQGRMAASGGYWLSMDADTIVAAPATLTGSIGVIGGWLWNRGFAQSLGLSADKVKTGRHADLTLGYRLPLLNLPLPERNLTAEEKQLMEARIKALYNQFVASVASGRGLPVDSVKALAAGRIFSGEKARSLGLVDVIGGLDDAIDLAADMAGLRPGDNRQIRIYPARPLLNLSRFMPRLYGVDTETIRPLPLRLLDLLAAQAGQPLLLLPSEDWWWDDTGSGNL